MRAGASEGTGARAPAVVPPATVVLCVREKKQPRSPDAGTGPPWSKPASVASAASPQRRTCLRRRRRRGRWCLLRRGFARFAGLGSDGGAGSSVAAPPGLPVGRLLMRAAPGVELLSRSSRVFEKRLLSAAEPPPLRTHSSDLHSILFYCGASGYSVS